MDVRQARPTDAPLALSLALDERAHVVATSGWPATNQWLRTLTRTVFPLAVSGRAWIGRDRKTTALLEAAPRRYVIGWDVTRLAVRNDHLIVGPMIDAATEHVRAHGVPRLFARCSEENDAVLRGVGFMPLGREYVLVGPDAVSPTDSPLPVDSRYRMPQDAWPLHQLESAVTPPLVRQMEGLTSLEWSQKIKGMSEIVVEGEGRILLWIGWGVPLGKDLRQIGMLVHPDARDMAPDILHHVLQSAPRNQRYVARVRDYQSEVVSIFLQAGFRIAAEEIFMVKHAGVELARVERRRMRVAHMPSIQGLNSRLGVPPSPVTARMRTTSTVKDT